MTNPMEAFRRIRRLQIKALRQVNDVFAGNYRSTFKGKGLEFEDVREYQPGDDIRRIDWNVSARSQQLFVKNFREERELTVILAIDISASGHFSHTSPLKSELIAEVAAILAFSAIKNQDKVGLLLFTDQIELYIKPTKGVRHVLRVIRELLYFVPKGVGTDMTKALKFLGHVQRKRAVCFLFSDFLAQDFSKQVPILAKRHELIAFHVYDIFEKHFVPQGFFSLHDLETNQHSYIDTKNPNGQEHYQELAKKHTSAVKKMFKKAGAAYLSMYTGESSTEIIHRFFRLRGYVK